MHTRILLLFFCILPPCSVANAQWVQVSSPGAISSVARKDSNLFVGTYGPSYTGSVFRTSDNGLSWTNINNGLPNIEITSLLFNDTNLFASTTGKGIYRSTDYGRNWAATGGLTDSNINVLALLGNHIFTITSNAYSSSIFSSIDNGDNWKLIGSGLPTVGELAILDGNLFAGTRGGVFLSIDSGSNWLPINNGITDRGVICFSVLGKDLFVSCDQAGVFLTTDKGTHWVNKRPENIGVVYSLASSGNNLFAGMEFYGIELSINEGLNWTQIKTGFSTDYCYLFIFHDYLFVSTGGNLWRRPLSEMIPAAVPISNHLSAFHLNQNYPNPFSGSTTVGFDIPERTFVSLKVYDITGREVAVLANETLDAGSFTRNFNTEGMPSGTYICRFEAGAFRQARTLQLLR